MINVIILIDFKGHPILASEYVNSLRYSALQQITENHNIDREKCIILSIGNSGSDKKLNEIREIALLNKFKWLIIENPDTTVNDIEHLLMKKFNLIINKDNTRIILGGCNTSGCVLKTKNISIKDFGLKKYETLVPLQLCAEYECSGINDIEKNMKAFSRLFNYVQKNKFETIVTVEDITQIVKYIKKNNVMKEKI